MKAVIMAGGSGTRLWPVSRKHAPKQGQSIGDDETLLQKTYRRLRTGWPNRDIIVSTSVEQYPRLRKQLPHFSRKHFILETDRRDTAPAIGLVATYLYKHNPHEVMFTVNSDTHIKEVGEFVRVIRSAGNAVERYPRQIILIGVKPRSADTGMGYIKMKQQVDSVGKYELFLVDRFIEKPHLATAQRFTRSWQYLWNPAMFVFRVDAMLEKFRRWLPSTYKLLTNISDAIGTRRENSTVKRLFPKMQKISIDFGIMEKDRSLLVIPADLTWSDIGTWAAVYEMLAERGHDNVVRGLHVTHDSSGNIIYSYSGKLIATAGVKNMIIIETDDAMLVCPKDRAQDVKKIVAEIERRKLSQYL